MLKSCNKLKKKKKLPQRHGCSYLFKDMPVFICMNDSEDYFMPNPDIKIRIMASDGKQMQT